MRWFDEIVLNSDALVAVSKSAAEEFLAYVAANEKVVNPKMQVGWTYCADFEIEIHERRCRGSCSFAPEARRFS